MTSPVASAALPEAFELESKLRIAVTAVEEAGAFLRAQAGGLIDFRGKGTTGDVVSELDVLAEQLIVRRLRGAFPDIPVLAEESGLIQAVRTRESPYLWLVDPLDGTNNLAIGLPAYATGVALCWNGEPVVSAVHEPHSARTWRAYRGGGLFGPPGEPTARTRRFGAGKPLVAWTQGYGVNGTDPAKGAIKAVLEHEARRTLALWAPLLGWTMLARGDIDAFIGYRPQLIDLPGGILLAQEAGFEVKNPEGDPFATRIDQHTDPEADLSFVCARPDLMPQLLDWIRRAHRLAPQYARALEVY